MPEPSPLLPFVAEPPRRVRFAVRPRPPRPLEPVDGLLAGVAEADLTPPPGMPKAGYSANAHNGSGFRTRLRARVIHLRSGTSSLALVQCDLLGGSAVLQHLVARAIADDTDVALAGLLIGATHTHAGPGQYLGTDFYNRFASNRSGFDPAYTQFLVDQIVGAVTSAVSSRRPAVAAIGSLDVWGRTRNRSLAAHVRNPELDDASTTPERKFHAVNPALHLLRVDALVDVDAADDTDGTPGAGGAHDVERATTPLGAMVVFSVHGTGIPMTAHEYNADIWAYLVGELRHRIRQRTGADTVVGAIEGTHADVAPAIHPGAAGHLEAARLGRSLGAEADVLHERLADQLTEVFPLAAGFREVDLERSSSIGTITLPRRPAVGAALVAGAHENVTPVVHRIPPFAPGRPKTWGRTVEQGGKWIIGSRWLQPVVLRLAQFPRILPVQVLRIGSTALVGLPFEITVETGARVEAAVAGALGDGADRVIVSSVANEYAGYAATPEEYERQHYEGAHTLYGPATQPFLAAHAAALARDLAGAGTVQDVVEPRRFDLRATRHLARPNAAGVVERRFVGRPRFVDPTRDADGYWTLEWDDVVPGNLRWHEPLVRIETSEDGGATWAPGTQEGRVLDDQGWALQVIHTGPSPGAGAGAPGAAHRYSLRWWDPIVGGAALHRAVLVANAGRPEVASDPFR
jgi:neutral ceramidase